ncbi:MAG: hypothetical protein ACTSX6_14075 [Candidatus Heimdallarchaeaceae archaeon]
MFANDYKKPNQKSETIKRRTRKFFIEHSHPDIYFNVLESLRQIRNQKAHEGFVCSEKVEYLGSLVLENIHNNPSNTYFEVKEILRVILKDFWLLLRRFNYELVKTRKFLDS